MKSMLVEQNEEYNPVPSIAELRVQLNDNWSKSVCLLDL